MELTKSKKDFFKSVALGEMTIEKQFIKNKDFVSYFSEKMEKEKPRLAAIIEVTMEGELVGFIYENYDYIYHINLYNTIHLCSHCGAIWQRRRYIKCTSELEQKFKWRVEYEACANDLGGHILLEDFEWGRYPEEICNRYSYELILNQIKNPNKLAYAKYLYRLD